MKELLEKIEAEMAVFTKDAALQMEIIIKPLEHVHAKPPMNIIRPKPFMQYTHQFRLIIKWNTFQRGSCFKI